jgi:FkbM family methyltransferase
MSKFQLVNYNFDNQQVDIRVNYPVKNGYIIIKDIDLDTTIYKMRIWNVEPGLVIFITPTPRHGFDFQREDFGGFTFELIDEDVILERQNLRFRYTNMNQFKQNINDFYHPVFVNYREFFVYNKYKDFNLEGCENVIDAGASVGLFTQYMLNKGAKQVASIECDDRSIVALFSNFIGNPKVKIIGMALSDIDGEKELYWKEDNPLVNSLDINGSEFSTQDNPNSKTVKTTTLETLIRNLNWDKIDLLKIDIEGSEWDVINNTPDGVFQFIDKILLEYHWPKGRLQSVISRLQSLGFKHMFESGCNGSEENGTVFFSK